KPLAIADLPQVIVSNYTYDSQQLQLLQYVSPEFIKAEDWLTQCVNDLYSADKTLVSLIFDCNEYIFNHFRYIKGITT
ncbi:hypothetical protein, partial [Streptomyces caniscabiei]|uniref:hypothetical protein n=1 Tax=Streptomyces caniscabiei TaxID=2746961 RepID=UPI0038F7E24D